MKFQGCELDLRSVLFVTLWLSVKPGMGIKEWNGEWNEECENPEL